MIVWLCWVYDAITNFAPLRLHAAISHGESMLAAERWLGIDPELSLDRWLAGHHTLGLLVSDYYDNAHFIVTLGLLGWLWVRRADIYRPLRNVLVLTNVIAFVVFWLYPVAPPRMLRLRLQRRGRLDARVRLLAHRRAGLGGEPAGGYALAAHGMGGMVRSRAVAVVGAPMGSCGGGAVPLHDGVRGAGDGQSLRDGRARRLATLVVAMLIEATILRKIRPPRVAHVTNLLRSLIPGRLNPSSQAAHKR